MNLKQFFNKSTYGTVGYISSQSDIDLLEQYILYNLSVLKEFKEIIVATNYNDNKKLILSNNKMWLKYFPNIKCINNSVNRGHSFGTADLDNIVFNYCKSKNIKWLCKASNDIIMESHILDKEIEEADFYFMNGISYEDLYLNNFNYDKIYNEHFFPQTNFYLINVEKCDYLNDKEYLDKTYNYSKTINNFSGKIWEYIKEWSCENFLKQCVQRNNLSKYNLVSKDKNIILCELINLYKIGDPSHKNIMIDGICHLQNNKEKIFEI